MGGLCKRKEDNCLMIKQLRGVQVYEIGSLDMSIYKCITEDYTTDKIVITEKQLLHIK